MSICLPRPCLSPTLGRSRLQAYLRVGIWLLLGSLGLSLPSLWAQPRVTSPYRADFFATEAGLPGNQVNDIEQTADGYLWVATNGGLARFDGHRFTFTQVLS